MNYAINGLAGLVIGAISILPGCGNYKVVNHVRYHETGIVSHEDAPHNLEIVSLYGRNYYVQTDNESGVGFALIPRNSTIKTIDEQGRTIELKADETFLAVPVIRNERLASRASLRTEGKFAVRARRERLGAIEDIGNLKENSEKYSIKTITIGGKEFYFPYRTDSSKEGRTNFWAIPIQDHEREINPEGRITIINPGGIHEWIEKRVYEKERKDLEQTKKAKSLIEANKKQGRNKEEILRILRENNIPQYITQQTNIQKSLKEKYDSSGSVDVVE